MKTITGTWAGPSNANITPIVGTLTLYMQLSKNAYVTVGATAQVSAGVLISIPLTVASIPGSTTIWANDQLTPVDTFYLCKIKDSAGNILWTANLTIAGASPIDLTTLVPS